MQDRLAKNWFIAGVAAVVALTLYRIAFLWFDQTDLFVDESQYWLWGQKFDFGYYSKPPLIAWVISLFTGLAQSDAIPWVRLPSPLFHMVSAVILGVLARYLYNPKTAFWVMISYITVPAAGLGSWVISTDTIMAPFYALALLFYFRLLQEGKTRDALFAGLAAGMAFMAKYAGVYFLLCAFLAAVFMPSARPGWRNAAVLFVAFLVVAMPNIVWNFLNDLSTFNHTLDNAEWIRQAPPEVGDKPLRLRFDKLAEFFFSQFGVFGPILFGALIVCVFQPGGQKERQLLLFSVPIILLICVQALLSGANANWAVAAYFAAIILTVHAMLERRHVKLLTASVAIGLFLSLAFPVLTSVAYDVSIDGEKPAMRRMLGRAAMSREIMDAARTVDADIITVRSRDIAADLFYTVGEGDAEFRVVAPPSGPTNYYELHYPLTALDMQKKVMLVTWRSPIQCGDRTITPFTALTTTGGAYHGGRLYAYVLEADCYDDLTNRW